MANELKPCPFCGGEAEVGLDQGSFGMSYAFAYCKNCKARSKQFAVRYDICAKDEAINAWNRRWKDGRCEMDQSFDKYV